jgi:Tfp pilus assembly protein PilF
MRKEPIYLIAVLVVAAALRFTGLTQGESDFVPTGEPGAKAYYHFHPDEETLARAALRLESLFEPPLTAYGTLPMLLGRGVLEFFGLFRDGPLEVGGESRAFVIQTLRVLSALCSLATVALVYWLGRRHWGLGVGIGAAGFTALAPVAIQQAHFYTVDGIFTLLALAVLAVGMEAVIADRRGLLLFAGALVGLAGATRLNGLALGGVVASGFLLGRNLNWRAAALRLKRPDLWLSGLAALVVLLMLEPYLATQPEILLRDDYSDDFGYSLKVARGEVIRPWSMVDVHTVPYLHYWTHLWPQAVGWPLTLLFVGGFGYALWRRAWAGLVVACWCGLYFFSIGGLHTKHVRYLLPMLPGLSLLAAGLCAGLWRWRPGQVATAAIALYTAAYGVAFAGIYRGEDSRIQAARWIYEQVPRGQNIGLETGGFSLQGLVDGKRYGKHFINSRRLFSTRGYLACRTGAEYLQGQLDQAHFVAITDVNRYRQYAAVPGLFPVLHDFYTKLVAGELGFEPVRRFKVYPTLLGLDFGDDNAEPSFYGYDHPAVLVLRRTEQFDAAWVMWKESLRADARCADGVLAGLATALNAGDLDRAEVLLEEVETSYPHMRLAALVAAELHGRRGKEEQMQAALTRYVWGYEDKSHSAQLIPWAAGSSLVDLGLLDLARAALVDGANKRSFMRAEHKTTMARSYTRIARRLLRDGEQMLAEEVLRMAALIDARPGTCNALAELASEDGRRKEALSWWETSLELDARQVHVLRLAGKLAYELERYGQALYWLARAVELDGRLNPAQKAEDYEALAAEAEKVGEAERAAELRARVGW